MIKNLILDWSGTVVDDLTAVWHSTNHVLEAHGLPSITREQFRERFSLPWINFYKTWAPQIPREALEKVFWEKMTLEAEQIELLPHALEFLEFTRQQHLPVFICTTVNTAAFDRQAARLGVAPFLTRAYAGIEDKRELIHSILADNRLDPLETLFVGDMVHDLETAQHGGLHACGVLTGYDREEKLAKAKPDFLLRDLRELRLILQSQITALSEHPVLAVGALIFNGAGECLMFRTRKWSDKWGIPGGKVRRGETAETALRREVLEETGLRLRTTRFATWQDCIESTEFHRPAHFLLLNYTAVAEPGEVILNDEAQAWRWLPPAEALHALDLNQPTRTLLEHVLQKQAED